MKKMPYGPSLYYASDKNVFDALTHNKVDSQTILELFSKRNIVVSKRTPRETLAEYFSKQLHDYQDHKNIAAKLGIAPRRERITSMDVLGSTDKDHLLIAVEEIKRDLESAGDVVRVSRDGEKLSLVVQYSEMDYKVNAFAQRQERDGTIELIKTNDGYTVRNTHNNYLDSVTTELISKLEKKSAVPIEKVTVSLIDIPRPSLRSKFFHELAFRLPGYQHADVTAAYVYKPKPVIDEDEEDEDEGGTEDSDTHIERVHLKGKGVTRSEILNKLLDEDDYYIIKLAWRARAIMGSGNSYDIEATFTNPKDCTGFSFILIGVYQREDGITSLRRRPPQKHEIDEISRVMESSAKEFVSNLRIEFMAESDDGAK